VRSTSLPASLHETANADRSSAVWADNADTVSRAYSGTGALKTDYTRFVPRALSFLSPAHLFVPRSTGKRSKEGALQDGINSIIRYVKNNFLDGPRQDAYDLVTGTWVPKRGEELGWPSKQTLAIRAVRSF
jgi:hypothetical protein